MDDNTTIIVPADQMQFGEFCTLLEELYNINNSSKKSKKEEQEKVLYEFINKFRINAVNIEGSKNCTLFPILRLLLPALERERNAYNLKASKLGQLLVKVLSLHKNSRDAQNLTNFRTTTTSKYGSDFPGVAYFVLKNRVDGSGKLTIKDINDALDKISNAEIGNKGVVLDEVFSYVLMNTTAMQQKWFLRIILKDLKLGVGQDRLLSVFHPDAPECYQSCNSLLKVCEELEDENMRPLELGVKLFSAVSPMLSERLDVTRTSKLPQNTSYQIEIKFDGERFQMHMSNGTFEYFSRRGYSYTDKYGKTYSDGVLTPHLKNCFSADAENFVLDGEMMGWHKVHKCFGSKGMSYDIKKITENSRYQPCFCAFDILYYNGRSLVGPQEKGGMPLCDRLKILDKLFKDIPGVICHSKREMVNTLSEIVESLNKANENGEEGIVVKDVNSYYIANKRNAGWYKVKQEYSEGTMEDMDLVIIGADYAENKTHGLVNSFIVAVADTNVSGELPQRWLSMGKVSTGLSFEERDRITAILEPHWKVAAKVASPDCLVWNKIKPELWIHPDNSIVLQVRASELINSKDFATMYTLRFPRILRVREDKPVKDIMTLDELNELVKEKLPVIKLSTGQVNLEDVKDATEIRQRRKRVAPLEVADHFKAVTTDNVEVTSKALDGRKICVLSDDEDCKKVDLESLIRSHGGIVVQNIGSDTWCCVAGRKTVRVYNVMDNLTCDVVNTSWLRSLPNTNKLCPIPSPVEMMATTKKTQLVLARHYDRFGDHYTELADEDSLKACFLKMDADNHVPLHLMTDEMLQLDHELFDNGSPFSYLRGCFIHFSDIHHRLAIKTRAFGAVTSHINSPNLTHVIMTNDFVRDDTKLFVNVDAVYYVTENWLETCFEEKKRISEETFLVSNLGCM